MALVLPAINGSGQPEPGANSSRVCRPSVSRLSDSTKDRHRVRYRSSGQPGHREPTIAPVPGSHQKGRDVRKRRRTGHQVVRVGRVYQDLLVLVAATPLPRPVHAVTRPPEQVVCHGDRARAVVIVGVRVLGHHCPPLPRASAEEALLPTPVGAGRFVIRATHERGVGLPSSRSLATASHEATATLCGATDGGYASE